MDLKTYFFVLKSIENKSIALNSKLLLGTQQQLLNDTGLGLTSIKTYFRLMQDESLIIKEGNCKYRVCAELFDKIALLKEVYKFE